MKGLNISNLSTKPTHTGEFSPKANRDLKDTDIVIFGGVGASRINQSKENGLFKATSTSGFFSKLRAAFKPKANAQDVYNICRAHGMSVEQAGKALVNIKVASDRMGLSGFSAKALQNELQQHNMF